MRTANRDELCKYLGDIGVTKLKLFEREGLSVARLSTIPGAHPLYDLDAVDQWLTRDQRPVEQPSEPTKGQGKPGKRKGPDVKMMAESMVVA